jgi:hypothetical protein
MPRRVTVRIGGQAYEAEMGHSGHWYLRVGGTALTSFGASPGETDDAIAGRIRRWVADHPGIRSRKDIHLGGG